MGVWKARRELLYYVPLLGPHKVESVTRVSHSSVSSPAHSQFQVPLPRKRRSRLPRTSGLRILQSTLLHPRSGGRGVEREGQGLRNLCHVLDEEGGPPPASRRVSSPPRDAKPWTPAGPAHLQSPALRGSLPKRRRQLLLTGSG